MKLTEKIFQVGHAGRNTNKDLFLVKQKKWKLFRWKKTAFITKPSHTYRGYASTYNVEILNSFSSELRLKETETAIKNKLRDLISALRGFKFVILEFRKIESDDETKHSNHIVILIMYLYQY